MPSSSSILARAIDGQLREKRSVIVRSSFSSVSEIDNNGEEVLSEEAIDDDGGSCNCKNNCMIFSEHLKDNVVSLYSQKTYFERTKIFGVLKNNVVLEKGHFRVIISLCLADQYS